MHAYHASSVLISASYGTGIRKEAGHSVSFSVHQSEKIDYFIVLFCVDFECLFPATFG
jgi:hypothetical protein